jgi:peptide deformylase
MNAAGVGEQPDLKEFINPEIIEKSDETEDGREGCFSTGRVCGVVERATKVTVRAYNREGQQFEHVFEGFPARVAQHEIDHLDGIRFPDHISDDKNLHWVEEAEFGDYRGNWRNWSVNCPREKWESIKSGKQ